MTTLPLASGEKHWSRSMQPSIRMQLPPLPKGDVIFTFVGGLYDGHARELQRPPAMDPMICEWMNSKGGQVGHRFPVVSTATAEQLRNSNFTIKPDGSIESDFTPGPSHVYEITNREEQGDDIYVRCEYRGTPEDFVYEAFRGQS